MFDREKELGEEKRLVTDLLADLRILSCSYKIDETQFKLERKRIVQVGMNANLK